MEGYAILRFGQALENVTMPTPVPQGTEVLLETTHAGVCHSDLHLIEGGYDLGSRGRLDSAKRGMSLPIYPGHEIVGKVVSWGAGANDAGLRAGELRLVYSWVGCGKCPRCRAEESNLCDRMRPIGVASNGGLGSHVLVPHPRFLVDIEGLDPALASTYGCSGLSLYGAVRKLLPLDPKTMVVVIGAGGLGLNGVAVLRALGHERICAVDNSAAKLEAAIQQGAQKIVLVGDDPAATSAAILDACDGVVLAIIDTVNSGATALFAFDALSRGGTVIQVGLFGGELRLPLPLVPTRSLNIRGSCAGTVADLRDLVALAKRGALPQIPVTTRPLHQANQALDDLRAGKVVGRVVLTAPEKLPG